MASTTTRSTSRSGVALRKLVWVGVLATWYICLEKVTVKREHAFTDCKRRAAQVTCVGENRCSHYHKISNLSS